MNHTCRILLAALLSWVAPQAARSGEDPKPAKIFSGDPVMQVTIDAPWRTIVRQRRRNTEWQGQFIFDSAGRGRVSIPVTISLRGLTRLRVCEFPPLRLAFDKEAARGTEFRGAGSLKLVSHCFNQQRYAQYYIKEYLAYRIYNLITPVSYRVQGLDIRYADSASGADPIERFGFLIEDPDDVAARLDLQKLNVEEASVARLDPLETSRFMLFQYLIANLDWSVLSGPEDVCCHNARIVAASANADVMYAIPYDLDSAGLVDAHYAAPPEKLRVRTVRQRLFRGFCKHNEALPAALEEYRAKRADIIALFEDEPRLDSRNRTDAIRFLSGFWKYLEDESDVRKKLTDNCRG